MVEAPKQNSPMLSGPLDSISFDEFWQKEDELWEISLKESIRQTKERKKKLHEKKLYKVWK